MATKLGVFNGALLEIGQERVSDTGEPVKAARVIVDRYDAVVAECLVAGSWNFAMEFRKIDGDTGAIAYTDTGTIGKGYQYGFTKPTDWVRTVGVSLDEYFSVPLTDYYDDNQIIRADSTPIYVRYVSNDTGLGLDIAKWPQRFTRYVELELADRCCKAITEDDSTKERIERDRDRARRSALSQDAMDEAQPKFAPAGSWTVARGGRYGGERRRQRGTLY